MKESITYNNATVTGTDHNKILHVTIDTGSGPRRHEFRRGDLWDSIEKVVSDLYHRQRFTLTLRQLYYQLVAKDLIPNHDKMYKKLGGELTTMRRIGRIDWSAIEDRNRETRVAYKEEDVPSALEKTLIGYRLDRQIGQPIHIEVMAEKDAVSNVIAPVCNRMSVPYSINRGYLSTSAMYKAYSRFEAALMLGKPVRILYLGDHDPSGIQMRDDIAKRIIEFLLCGEMNIGVMGSRNNSAIEKMFDEYFVQTEMDEETEKWYPLVDGMQLPIMSDLGLQFDDEWDAEIAAWLELDGFKLIDVALNMDQIRTMDLPPNPAKLTDSRAAAYIERFGRSSWELDAIPPAQMQEILQESLDELIDQGAYDAILERESSDKSNLSEIINSLKDDNDE